jgi:hypothetical protein
MNAKDLLIKALADMGADGLYNADLECGCGLDDLIPCDTCECEVCEPAIKKGKKTGSLFYPMEVTCPKT